MVGRHGCTLDEIKELFHSYSDKIVTEPMDNGEFDVMVRFDDGSDPYYYCFKDEGCHIIYHRFLPEDYADFGFWQEFVINLPTVEPAKIYVTFAIKVCYFFVKYLQK